MVLNKTAMDDNHDQHAALSWVKDEIIVNLNQVQQAFEFLFEDPTNLTELTTCYNLLHQTSGALQMVGFPGAALFAEEMKTLCEALTHHEVDDIHHGLQILMQAALQLPSYLDIIQTEGHDIPIALLPIINEMRFIRKAPALNETELFYTEPQLPTSHLTVEELQEIDEEGLTVLLRKLRQSLQLALIDIIQNKNIDKTLDHLSKIFNYLARLCKTTPTSTLWRIAAAFSSGVAEGSIANTTEVKNLIKQIDKPLKLLAEQGINGMNTPAPEELIKKLLFQISQAESELPHILAIQQEYQLNHSILSAEAVTTNTTQAALTRVDKATLDSLAEALSEEFNQIKDQLDQITRNDSFSPADLEALPTSLKQISNTLETLGFEKQKNIVDEQLAAIKDIMATGHLDNNKLIDVASAMLGVESIIINIRAGYNEIKKKLTINTNIINNAQKTVIKEAANELVKVKDIISILFTSKGKEGNIKEASDSLEHIASVLAMVSLYRASAILICCLQYIEKQIYNKTTYLADQEVDALVCVIASVDYYLECLHKNQELSCKDALNFAVKYLNDLDYPLPENVEEFVAKHIAPSSNTITLNDVHTTTEPFTVELEPIVNETPVTNTDVNEIEQVQAVAIPEMTLQPFAVEKPTIEEEIDPELVEIFTEEMNEILEALAVSLPKWIANDRDTSSLAEIRRSFHTIKGSGRMMRASVISELGWAIENMLNRVIDNYIQPAEQLFQVIQDAIKLLPELITEFSSGQQHEREDVNYYSAVAHALAADKQPPQPPSLAETTTELTESEDIPLDDPQVEPEELDTELIDIFVGEAKTHLQKLKEFLIECEYSLPQQVTDSLQRAMHTLKGSALMAGIDSIATIAKPFEGYLKECNINGWLIERFDLELLQDAYSLLEGGVQQLGNYSLAPIEGADTLVERITLRRNSIFTHTEATLKSAASTSENDTAVPIAEQISDLLLHSMDLLLDADEYIEKWQKNPTENIAELPAICDELTHMSTVTRQIGFPQIGEICDALLRCYQVVTTNSIAKNEDFFEAILNAHNALLNTADQLAAAQVIDTHSEEIQRLDALLTKTSSETSPAEVNEEDVTETELSEPNPENTLEASEQLDSTSNFLTDGDGITPNAVNFKPISSPFSKNDEDTITEIAEVIEPVEEAETADAEQDITDSLEIADPAITEKDTAVEESLEELESAEHPTETKATEELDTAIDIEPISTEETDAAEIIIEPIEDPPAETLATDDIPIELITADDSIDQDMVDIFLDEADELLLESKEDLENWISDQDPESLNALQRQLHTLKGGARMCGAKSLGDIAHGLEFIYEGLLNDRYYYSEDLVKLLNKTHSAIQLMVDNLHEQKPLQFNPALLHTIQVFRQEGHIAFDNLATPTAANLETETSPVITAEPVKEIKELEEAPETNIEPITKEELEEELDIDISPIVLTETARPLPAAQQQQAAAKHSAEQIKVAANLLDSLVNLAGETSIYRSRVEQQVNDLSFSLFEIDVTIDRVHDQLRRLDIETQSQIISNHKTESTSSSQMQFDPLEMDQYSQIQQLSRSLFESASDLQDLKETLVRRNRDIETLLQQQGRINTELQEGLMRTRMVPLERIVPRLRRLVRQISSELGKQIELVIGNTAGEMDRNVIDAIVIPLEHMIRNAADHGIEDPEVRIAKGKPEKGSIHIDLVREGGEMVLYLRDDGAGISTKVVREKAIAKGLLNSDEQLSDKEALQFVLEAGFSTAKQVTQISGRGVGLDVVVNAVKQLGGTLTLESVEDQGTTFIIRLPINLSVSRALMIRVGEDNYAIPMSTIEGVSYITPDQLKEFYEFENAELEYGNESYRVKYLGELLGMPPLLQQQETVEKHPVLLVRSGGEHIALRVDELLPSNEIVVKTLGTQFLSVPAISGATILGDGNVIIILDLSALIRSHLALQHNEQKYHDRRAVATIPIKRVPLVMVVDDSVTVRKVTTRLLERQGLQVITARDGLDAVTQLEEKIPDIMLLDIEMPRMDGFEVATHVRHNEKTKHIPIIMITSRSGEKYKQHAFSIGVNEYMSKPFMEGKLVKSISELLPAFEINPVETRS